MYFINLTGKHYDRLTVVRPSPTKPGKPLKWLCKCICGEQRIVRGAQLRSGTTKCCMQCFRKDVGKRFRKYPEGAVYTYASWRSMRSRCLQVKPGSYSTTHYVDRGIKICKRWSKFENFLKDMGLRPKGKSIERRNNDGSYTPGNCYWATPKQQGNNRRPRCDRPMLTYKGKTKSFKEWAEVTGMKKGTIAGRVARGWPVAKIFTAPARPWGR